MSRINEITTKQTDFTQSVKLAGVNNEGTPVDVYLRLDELYAVLAYEGRTSSFEFGGQAHGGSYIKTFAETAVFDANNGNNQYMEVTNDTTISIENELPGQFTIELEINTTSNPIISIDNSFGEELDNTLPITSINNGINIIRLYVNPNGEKRYKINTKIPSISVPTIILLGDSNLDGRVLNGSNRQFPVYADDITSDDKETVKIFDNVGGTDTFVTLNAANSQCRSTPTYSHGPEQTLMWELAQHYGVEEIRVIKQGVGSTFAGIPTGSSTALSWQPTYQQMLDFEQTISDAEDAAALEGIQLDYVGVVSFLGTNDAVESGTSANYETNMTTIINHIRNNVINNTGLPFVITSATEGTTYHSTVISEQLSLVGNVSNAYYENIYRFGRGIVHPGQAGVFSMGLACADNVLINILGESTIKSKYGFSYTTNQSGTYSILTRYLENITDYQIDWGDGNVTDVTTNNSTWNNTYADSSEKLISINTFTLWNFITLTLNTSGTKIVGEFDMSNLTGLDSLNTSSANIEMTNIIEPIANNDELVAMATNLLYNADALTGVFDFKRFKMVTSFNFHNNNLLTGFEDTSSIQKTFVSSVFRGNSISTEYNFSNIIFTGSNQCRINPELLTIIAPSTQPSGVASEMLSGSNPKLTNIVNYENWIYFRYLDLSNNDFPVSLTDNIINEMWDRSQDTTFYSGTGGKIVFLNGNNGYTGTFDGTTDWSGGLPTSPGAKAYDMLNDVTGTYNFTTFSL